MLFKVLDVELNILLETSSLPYSTVSPDYQDQLGFVPWWLWLIILIVVLCILIYGLFVTSDNAQRRPGSTRLPPLASDGQTSEGTESDIEAANTSANSENK